MSMNPITSFPLRASDQADVIEIFLDLMSKAPYATVSSEESNEHPDEPRTDWLPGPDRA